jgi:hypothetical protein
MDRTLMQSYKRHNLVQPVGRYSRSLQSMLTRKHPAPSAALNANATA